MMFWSVSRTANPSIPGLAQNLALLGQRARWVPRDITVKLPIPASLLHLPWGQVVPDASHPRCQLFHLSGDAPSGSPHPRLSFARFRVS